MLNKRLETSDVCSLSVIEISLVPETSVSTDLETSLKIYKLLETLEYIDDTQNVHYNADFPKEIVEHLE